MKISKREAGNVTIIEPKGKISIGKGDIAIRDAIDGALSGGADNILLDFKAVTRMDSAGLGELVAAHKAVTENGGAIKLMRLPSKLYNVLGMTQIVTVFDVFDDESEALSSFH